MPSYRQGGAIAYEPDSYDSDFDEAVQGTQYVKVMSFRAGEDLENAELVMFDVADSTNFLGHTVIAAAGASDGVDAQLVAGVTLESALDGGTVKVAVGGFCYCQADGAVSAGNALTNDGTVDGQVHAATIDGTDPILGVALEDDGDTVTGQVWMLLYPRF